MSIPGLVIVPQKGYKVFKTPYATMNDAPVLAPSTARSMYQWLSAWLKGPARTGTTSFLCSDRIRVIECAGVDAQQVELTLYYHDGTQDTVLLSTAPVEVLRDALQ